MWDGITVNRSVDDIKKQYDYILVMVERIKDVFAIVSQLVKEGVDKRSIVLGISIWGKYSHYDSIGICEICGITGLRLTYEGISVVVTTADEFYSVEETILNKCYDYSIPGDIPEIVVDIGMNIGDSTLFFARMNKCEKVYAYEPFKNVFEIARENLKNELMEKRVEIYNYGLSNYDRTETVVYCSEMSTGLSTITENTQKAKLDRQEWGLFNGNEIEIAEEVSIKNASDVIADIYKRNGNLKRYILKIDCEGEEYAIFKDLFDHDMLNIFCYIIVEWHGKGSDEIKDYLKDSFAIHTIVNDLLCDRGMLYAINVHNK